MRKPNEQGRGSNHIQQEGWGGLMRTGEDIRSQRWRGTMPSGGKGSGGTTTFVGSVWVRVLTIQRDVCEYSQAQTSPIRFQQSVTPQNSFKLLLVPKCEGYSWFQVGSSKTFCFAGNHGSITLGRHSPTREMSGS